MADCEYSVPDLAASGDALYGPRVCNQPFIDWAWDTFEFDYDWWQDGWGYDDPCNNTKPLGRTFNAIWALTYSAERVWTADHGNNMLEWAGKWAAEHKSGYALRARCGDKVATTYGAGCLEYQKSVQWDCTHYEDEGHSSCRSWFFLFAWICHAWFWVSSLVCKAWGYIASWVCAAAVGIFGSKHLDLQNTTYFYRARRARPRVDVRARSSPHVGQGASGQLPAGIELRQWQRRRRFVGLERGVALAGDLARVVLVRCDSEQRCVAGQGARRRQHDHARCLRDESRLHVLMAVVMPGR